MNYTLVQGVLLLVFAALFLALLVIGLGLVVERVRPGADTSRRATLHRHGFWVAGFDVLLIVVNLVLSHSTGGSPTPNEAVRELWNYAVHGRFRDCMRCPLMVKVPSGEFTMGSPDTDNDRDEDEEPQHRVKIGDRLEAVGVYEITFEEWFECVLHGGCMIPRGNLLQEEPNRLSKALRGEGSDGLADRPVIYVSWNDAQRYVAWLRKATGKSYRLLSEAEWEYVARAGSSGTRFWDNLEDQCLYTNGVDGSWGLNQDEMASVRDGVDRIEAGLVSLEKGAASAREWVNSIPDETDSDSDSINRGVKSIQEWAASLRDQVDLIKDAVATIDTGVGNVNAGVVSMQNDAEPNAPAPCSDNEPGLASVGSYQPNEFGLYDVIGNVHEWTQDCWHENYQGAPGNGGSWEERNGCESRVARGGAWYSFPEALRLAVRTGSLATDRRNGIGLRVALAPE